MAVRFDASGDKLTRTTGLPSSPRGFTICGLFYVSVDRNDWSTFFNISAGSINQYAYIQSNGTGTAFELWNDGSGTALFTASIGAWYFVAMTISPTGTCKGYYAPLDGSLSVVTHGSTTGTWTPTLLAVGDSVFTGEFLNGRADKVRAWTAELTQAELEREMRSPEAVRLENIYGDWQMFPGATERLADWSGNGNNWTAGGTLADEDDPPFVWEVVPPSLNFAASGTSTNLTVQDASHDHVADGIVLTVNAGLTIDDATHGQAADAIALTANASIAVQEATHSHAADEIGLTVMAGLEVQDAAHIHTADAIGLTTNATLEIQDAAHSHVVGVIDLTANTVVDIQDAAHIHGADVITLTANASLEVQDATHTHTSDEVTLGLGDSLTLTVQEATHSHASDAITLSTGDVLNLTVQDAAHEHATNQLGLTANVYVDAIGASHEHSTDGVNLSAVSYVEITEATHEHIVDAADLIVSSYLDLADCVHLHQADDIVLGMPGSGGRNGPSMSSMEGAMRSL